MAPEQGANSDNLGKSFQFSTQYKKNSLTICFLELAK